MKNNKDMAKELLEIRDEYNAKRAVVRKKVRFAIIIAAIIAAVAAVSIPVAAMISSGGAHSSPGDIGTAVSDDAVDSEPILCFPSVGYPVTKVNVPAVGGNFGTVPWDGNNDGVSDKIVIFVGGSGISNESLYYVDGKTDEQTLIWRSMNNDIAIGFAETDDKTPLLFNRIDALYSEDMRTALVEPFAKITFENGKPVITALWQGDGTKIKYTEFEDGEAVEREMALREAENKYIDDATLDSLEGLYVDISYYEAVVKDGVLTTVRRYITVEGDAAKALYRIFTESAEKYRGENNHFSADRDSFECTFILKDGGKAADEYYFCGSYGVQIRDGQEYLMQKAGALHDPTEYFGITNKVYSSVMRAFSEE